MRVQQHSPGKQREGLQPLRSARRSTLVVLAIPFLVLSGVTLDHIRTAATTDMGFEPKGLIAAPLDFASTSDTDDRAASFLRTARANLEGTSGIASAGAADGLPLDRRSRWVRVVRVGSSADTMVRPTRVDEGPKPGAVSSWLLESTATCPPAVTRRSSRSRSRELAIAPILARR